MPVPLAVVGAHPGDETIGAAGLLLRAGRAVVVHLTDGAPRERALRAGNEPDREAYARRRRDEALAALAVAGLGARDVLALGATDQEAARAIAPIARELAAALAAFEPRIVVTHSFEGGHPDHDAAALATRAALALLERRGVARPRLFEMTAYHRRAGRLETGRFLSGGGRAITHVLTGGERAAKRRMLDAHASQRALVSQIAVAVERFRLAGDLALVRPHPAPLHYEAVGWTSFERFRALALDALRALAPDAPEPQPG